MSALSEKPNARELRAQISELRRDLAATTEEYNSVKRSGRSERVVQLLRQRSKLVRRLFELQSLLLVAYRTEPSAAVNKPA
jgi:hypothetical protein